VAHVRQDPHIPTLSDVHGVEKYSPTSQSAQQVVSVSKSIAFASSVGSHTVTSNGT
jgi:hypothetical protein